MKTNQIRGWRIIIGAILVFALGNDSIGFVTFFILMVLNLNTEIGFNINDDGGR